MKQAHKNTLMLISIMIIIMLIIVIFIIVDFFWDTLYFHWMQNNLTKLVESRIQAENKTCNQRIKETAAHIIFETQVPQLFDLTPDQT